MRKTGIKMRPWVGVIHVLQGDYTGVEGIWEFMSVQYKNTPRLVVDYYSAVQFSYEFSCSSQNEVFKKIGLDYYMMRSTARCAC
jgi:hypothetical protein